MRRPIAILLASTLVCAAAQLSALHIHVYADHDHPAHHHGPAAHEHHVISTHPEDGAVHLESCDPGMHVLSLHFLCAAPPQTHTVDADFVAPSFTLPRLVLHHTVPVTDLRVHSPPPCTLASSRAPPQIIPA